MAIIDSLRGFFGTRQRPVTTIDEMIPAADGRQPSSLTNRFSSGGDREKVIGECRRMYQEDPRAKSILTTLSRDVVKGGFRIETDDPAATEIAEALVNRIKLVGRLDDWCRMAFRDGDCLLELGVSEENRIDAVSRKPTLRIERNTDNTDNFVDPARAYRMANSGFANYRGRPGQDDIWFAEWQIVHARWDHDEGNRYGQPLLASSRSAWKRMREGELDVAVRRKTRSGLKFVHRLQGADAAALARYKEDNKAALSNPFAAISDFFMSEDGQVDVIQGDARLSEIEDILHHTRTFFLASPVPMTVLGYGQDINYSVVHHQKLQYDETITQIQEWVAKEFVWPILEIEWLLHGYLPENLNARVTWASKKQIDADQIGKIAQALGTLRMLGVGEAAIISILAHFLPGIEIGSELEVDPSGEQAEQLARITQALTANIRHSEQEGADGIN
jgi:hypothetical protein